MTKHTVYTREEYVALCTKLVRGGVRVNVKKVCKLSQIVAWIVTY